MGKEFQNNFPASHRIMSNLIDGLIPESQGYVQTLFLITYQFIACTRSVKSSIDAVQKTARGTQAYLDQNDEETITTINFTWEGYLETIEGKGGGIVGSADKLFSGFLSLVVQKNYLFTFFAFPYIFSFLLSLPTNFFSFLLDRMV